MNISVLQGLNLKNSTTTVVAELEAAKPDLLDFFKDLHPIFLTGYTISNKKTVEVQTRIPSLWKNEEFIKPIELHATGEIDYSEAENQMLEVVRIQIRSMSTIPLLSAAHEMGFETYHLYINEGIPSSLRFNRVYAIGIGRELQTIYASASSKDSHNATKTQRDKSFTNQIIEKMGLPIAKWALIETKEELAEAAKNVGFPMVLKPTGLTGGHGVQIGMKNLEELEEAWDRTQGYFKDEMKYPEAKSDWQMKIIVQQKLTGEDYRILVIGGKFAVGTHRLQARVTGDGISTVENLIEKENENPARDLRLPTHTLKPIVIDKDLKKVLANQNLSLDYVPKKDEVVRVRDVASMSQGGITADVTDEVHPQIRLICETLARTIQAYVLGVDVLCQDISKPLTLENGGIIEMNTMPEMYLNIYPVIGKNYPEVPKRMIEGLMAGTERTKRVVVIGNLDSARVINLVRQELPETEHIGCMRGGTISFDEIEINKGLTIHEAVLSIKKNALLDTIVLHYDTIEEIEQNGLGFDEIELMIADPNTAKPIESVIQTYKEKGYIKKLITT